MGVNLEVSETLIAAVSPKITVNENATGFTIIINDVNGEKTIEIKNGKDGGKGDPGDKGNGIEEVEFNDNYSITLKYTNGENYTTPSLKGKDGTGIVGIELRESVPDEYDTYAIVLDNGNETLFKVPNATIDGYLEKIEDKKNEAVAEIENLKETIPDEFKNEDVKIEKDETNGDIVFGGNVVKVEGITETDVRNIVESYKYTDNDGTVKSVNGNEPDENGNVTINVQQEDNSSKIITSAENSNGFLIFKNSDGNELFRVEIGTFETNIPATGIALDNSTLSFNTSSTKRLTATVTPANSTDTITWESSNTSVATVSNGAVTPVANGSCTITARAGNYSATCSITVNIAQTVTTYTVTKNLTNCSGKR